jgi:hypothetical protein
MPTISHKPQEWADLPGYFDDLSLTDEQIAEIADLFGLEPVDIRQRLSRGGRRNRNVRRRDKFHLRLSSAPLWTKP